jgi:hypothetical protein
MRKNSNSFLETKLSYYNHPYYGDCLHKSSSGNICRISDNVFKFTEYNFLPGEDGQLDGHYTFYVNINTFDYLIFQSSYYGSFTYTTPPTQNGWVKNLILREHTMVESIIAHKLLTSYFYDGDDINQEGNHLIEDSEFGKRCLITDYRGYVWCGLKPNDRSETDLEALSILDKDFKRVSCNVLKIGKITNKTKTHIELGKNKVYGFRYELPIHVLVNGKEEIYIMHRSIDPIYYEFYNFEKDGVLIMQYSQNFKGRPSELVKMLPELIKSL